MFNLESDYNDVVKELTSNKITFIEFKNEIIILGDKTKNIKVIQTRFIFKDNKLVNIITAIDGSFYYYQYLIGLIRMSPIKII